ncbi:MAG: M23 family metallopeptidase [Clostridia bacterium]|nr:M23 family metallopeptidase [Clostridia bacterium]
MEKKIKFSDNPTITRIIYAAVIAILCVSAIVIGIVAAASKSKEPTPPDDNPSTNIGDGSSNGEGDNNNEEEPPKEESPKPEAPKPLAFISPAVGTVTKEHDLSAPVFSLTLGAWKVHSGIDIATEEGAAVYAAEDGTVSRIYNDPMMGYTVEITHRDNIKTRYSGLAAGDAGLIAVGDVVECGQRIGTVGDTSVIELADETHLHFDLLLNDAAQNPLDYITEESKKASLGIEA